MSVARKEETATAWRPIDELGVAAPDQPLRELMGVSTSLTQSLRERCNGRFRLRLLREYPAAGEAARIREVLMLCDEVPWVFAQTVMPDAIVAQNPWLSGLGERPLGDTLFERPGVERRQLRFGVLRAGQPLFERAVAGAGLTDTTPLLWARRSTIHIGSQTMSVHEVFLPDAGCCSAG